MSSPTTSGKWRRARIMWLGVHAWLVNTQFAAHLVETVFADAHALRTQELAERGDNVLGLRVTLVQIAAVAMLTVELSGPRACLTSRSAIITKRRNDNPINLSWLLATSIARISSHCQTNHCLCQAKRATITVG